MPPRGFQPAFALRRMFEFHASRPEPAIPYAANQSDKMDHRRCNWLVLADKVTAGPAGTRYSSALSHVPTRTTFESSTGVCQQDTDKYYRVAWLGDLDTYRTMCVASELPFRRLLEEIRTMQLAA
jgi:hypothetical protein